MSFISIESFKSNLYDLCRPNRFRVYIDFPQSEFDEGDFYFVKGATIPDKVFGEIEIGWQGYRYKVAGDPSFSDVVVTFYNNIPANMGKSIRNKFETWFNLISDDYQNIKNVPNEYKGTVTIEQLDNRGEPIQAYVLELAHPKELSSIELSMDNTDQVEEFTVTFSYSYFTNKNNSTNSPSEVSGESIKSTPTIIV